MSEPLHPPDDKPAAHDDGGNDTARKPYEKPSFIREQLFETMALACGKINPQIGQCQMVRKVS